MELLTAIVTAGLTALAASYGNDRVISTTIQDMAHQPGSAPESRSAMFTGIGLVEAVPILIAIIAFLISLSG